MGKSTMYSELRNLLLVVSFNQPVNYGGQDIQPVVIEARVEAITDEGAVRNVRNIVNIGEVVTEKLTNEEIFKTVYGISPVLAEALKGVLMDAVEESMESVDTSKVEAIGVADIVKPVEKEI